MTYAYILTIKDTNEKHYFATLVALFTKFDYDTLRVKHVSLGKYSFKKGSYENKHILIERVIILNKADVLKEKEETKD